MEAATILYYAVGGGLGHITRAITILDRIGDAGLSARILASSVHAPLAARTSRHPVDCCPGGILASRRSYHAFLAGYLAEHAIDAIVLDTFPWGIVGEWKYLAADLPRLLIARSLKWDIYSGHVAPDGRGRGLPVPVKTLAIEPLEEPYRELLERRSAVADLHLPIVDAPLPEGPPAERCLVVHSGDATEQRELVDYARDVMNREGRSVEIETIFPDREIYPARAWFGRYRYVVSGAGYNMAAESSRAGAGRTHFLFPFKRKFDDQLRRIEHIRGGMWSDPRGGGADEAARWIAESLS